MGPILGQESFVYGRDCRWVLAPQGWAEFRCSRAAASRDTSARAVIETLGSRTAQNRVRQLAMESDRLATNDDQWVRTHSVARYGSGGEDGVATVTPLFV